jgi:hypothetical protein
LRRSVVASFGHRGSAGGAVRWAGRPERDELVDFVDRQGFVPTFSRREIAEAFANRVRQLKDRDSASVIVESLHPLVGQSLSSIVVRTAERVAAADRQMHAGEVRALELIQLHHDAASGATITARDVASRTRLGDATKQTNLAGEKHEDGQCFVSRDSLTIEASHATGRGAALDPVENPRPRPVSGGTSSANKTSPSGNHPEAEHRAPGRRSQRTVVRSRSGSRSMRRSRR